MAENSTYSVSFPSLQVLAQAYGADSYNSNSYNGQSGTTSSPAPLPPNTGLHLPSSVADIALLLGIAVAVGTFSFIISRILKRHKHN